MVIELHVVQFWSEIILVILNRTCARMIADHTSLHSVELHALLMLAFNVGKWLRLSLYW